MPKGYKNPPGLYMLKRNRLHDFLYFGVKKHRGVLLKTKTPNGVIWSCSETGAPYPKTQCEKLLYNFMLSAWDAGLLPTDPPDAMTYYGNEKFRTEYELYLAQFYPELLIGEDPLAD